MHSLQQLSKSWIPAFAGMTVVSCVPKVSSHTPIGRFFARTQTQATGGSGRLVYFARRVPWRAQNRPAAADRTRSRVILKKTFGTPPF